MSFDYRSFVGRPVVVGLANGVTRGPHVRYKVVSGVLRSVGRYDLELERGCFSIHNSKEAKDRVWVRKPSRINGFFYVIDSGCIECDVLIV